MRQGPNSKPGPGLPRCPCPVSPEAPSLTICSAAAGGKPSAPQRAALQFLLKAHKLCQQPKGAAGACAPGTGVQRSPSLSVSGSGLSKPSDAAMSSRTQGGRGRRIPRASPTWAAWWGGKLLSQDLKNSTKGRAGAGAKAWAKSPVLHTTTRGHLLGNTHLTCAGLRVKRPQTDIV